MSVDMDSDFYSDLPDGERDASALDRALDDFVRGRRRRVNRLEPALGATVDRMFALADVISTAAAVIILAIGINASVPGFRDQHAGLGTAVPTSDANDGYQISTLPLVLVDCDVEPRDREEVIDILSVDPGSDWYGESRGPALIDDGTFSQLDEVLRQWQACRYYGQTFQWLNLVSSNYLRAEVYGLRFPRPTYELSTLNDIIDGWQETDEARSPEADRAVSGNYLIIRNLDTTPVLTGSTRIDINVDIVSTEDGSVTGSGYVVFAFELDSWRISIVGIDHEVLQLVDPPECGVPVCPEYSQ
jgi:hypothetical protein